MLLFRILFFCSLMTLSLSAPARASDAVLASGAGYKKMVNALTNAYTQKTGRKVERLFGNMAKVTMLATSSGKVDMVLGDSAFMQKAGIPISTHQDLGRGKLVLAFAKGYENGSLDSLREAKRIALPDVSKAIYGKAAREYLISSGLLPDIQPRLVPVATVPQIFSYLATGEVDMGFMNLTHTMNVADKLGGYVVIDENGYNPIVIMAGILKECPNPESARNFLAFLKTPEAREIIQANGL